MLPDRRDFSLAQTVQADRPRLVRCNVENPDNSKVIWAMANPLLAKSESHCWEPQWDIDRD